MTNTNTDTNTISTPDRVWNVHRANNEARRAEALDRIRTAWAKPVSASDVLTAMRGNSRRMSAVERFDAERSR